MSRITGCLIVACAWLAISATAPPLRAQEPDEVEDPADGAARLKEVVAAEDMGENLEPWVFANLGAVGARKKLEEALGRDLGRYDRDYGLTPAQKRKLELAGRLDIKRFFDRFEDLRAEYRRVKGDWNQIANRVFELQRMGNQPHIELFGDRSMLVKTLKKTLTADQIARHAKTIYRTRVEWMAGFLDKRLSMTAEQHKQLVALVAEQTPPLGRYGSFDYDAILFQMSRLPREKLRAALDDAQCRELALRFDQARRMEGILISEGYISGAKPAASAAGEPLRSAVQRADKAALTRVGQGGSH